MVYFFFILQRGEEKKEHLNKIPIKVHPQYVQMDQRAENIFVFPLKDGGVLMSESIIAKKKKKKKTEKFGCNFLNWNFWFQLSKRLH